MVQVTHDISDICSIDALLGVGKKTRCMTRFSTTAGERGSADSVRDPRGMATKLYTNEGNWDWVWNNVPFFFVRDPIKFPSLVHSQKRNPGTNLRDSTMFWDWVTSNPESLHMVLWMFSEYGTFTSYRHMNSYQGHAHKWTMPDGSFKYVHMYLQADAGYKFHGDDDVERLAGANGDHATEDLADAIAAGNYPTWTAYVQVIDPADVHKFGFNIFDMTKHWDMGTYPKTLGTVDARPFGKMTLTQNPANYFAEVEQAAFSPSHLVPGIEPTVDPLLQARLFAYPDAQRHRLGVNYQQLPVNRPKHAYNPLLRDGAASMLGNYGNQLGYPSVQSPTQYSTSRTHEAAEWEKQMVTGPGFYDFNENDLLFPRTFWTHLAEDDKFAGWQEKLVANVARHLRPAERTVRHLVYDLLKRVHLDMAEMIEVATEGRVVKVQSSL